jgi:hypothetical protein
VIFTNTAKLKITRRGICNFELLRMNNLKIQYNAMAQCKLERLSLSIALLAIYSTLGLIKTNSKR